MLEYTATTENATNKITATPTDDTAEVVIEVNDVEIENGASATWTDGENEVVVTVSGNAPSTVYTVTVTAGSPDADSNVVGVGLADYMTLKS